MRLLKRIAGIFKNTSMKEKEVMKALIIGIDEYQSDRIANLKGCVNDAKGMAKVLKYHEDKRLNFDDCQVITSADGEKATSLQSISEAIHNFFQGRSDFALFYFSGHGTSNEVDGYLVTSDSRQYTQGFSMRSLLQLAHAAKGITEIVLIVDCCHSGTLGQAPFFGNDTTVLREGISILTASRPAQNAKESNGGGVFTRLIIDALSGGGADVMGKVTVASIYAYVDQALRERDQRPMFKSHVSRFFPLRRCEPSVSHEILRKLPEYFPESPDVKHKMDPRYEHTRKEGHKHIPRDPEREEIFKHFQKLRNARLLVANGDPDRPDLYFAAVNDGYCELTSLGKYYWKLASDGSI